MTKQRLPRILAALVALAAVSGACDATPLPYPPDIQTDRLVLLDDDLGNLVLTGSPGAAQPAGMRLRLYNASRPELSPGDFPVGADGSFSTSIGGHLIDVLRIDRTDVDPGTLAFVASGGEPGVRRVPEPTDADGDGWAVGLDCDDGNPRAFPGAAEVCDGVDNDCDGVFDESPSCAGLPCVSDADCADSNTCNGDELCSAGRCASGPLPVCDDGDPATVDRCDPSTDACAHDPAAVPLCGNGIVEPPESCDDGNTENGDGCAADCGGCSAAAEVCNGIDDDCDGLIDEGLSCGLPCAADADCGDGLFCTVETCVAGFCNLGDPNPCDDGDPANLDVCDETGDVCDHLTCGVEVCNGIDDDCDGMVDDGVCTCAAGETRCGTVCVDILFDNLNCGACGSACPAGQTCMRGICTA
jgi:cysteine-rich repeat protein